MGFIDLHLHLLPGVDDGAKTPEDALAMARALVALGFEQAAPSPHVNERAEPAHVCAARRAELGEALAREGVALALHPGAENVLDPGLVERVGREVRAIGAGRYLLAEVPYLAPVPALPQVIFRLKLKGLTPVVAHPERCREFERAGRAEEAVRAGAALQLDLGALTGRYGPVAKKLARRFLADGIYAVAATDLHSPRDAEKWVGDAIAELRREVGDAEANRLLGENPLRILRGEPLPER
jgi:protein-tyrosine phosphatase